MCLFPEGRAGMGAPGVGSGVRLAYLPVGPWDGYNVAGTQRASNARLKT